MKCFYCSKTIFIPHIILLTFLYNIFSLDETQVAELQDKLAEKDELLTETRLEALNSAAQLQALRETVAKLRAELNGMKKGRQVFFFL